MSNKLKAKKRRDNIQSKRKRKNLLQSTLVDKILLYDAPELYIRSSELSKDDNMDFIDVMKDVICATENGVGLAACQIGVNKRVCVLRADTSLNVLKVLINPLIIEKSSNRFVNGEEGCLSFPGIVSEIERPYKIKVKYLDENLTEHIENFEGFESKVIGHEIDHFNGECEIAKIWKKQNS